MKHCPAPDALEGLLAGVLTDAEAGACRGHLAECPHCQSVMDGLTDHPDLCHWVAVAEGLTPLPLDTPPLRRLLDALRAPPPQATLPAGDALSFLSAPEEQGDLGSLGPYRIVSDLGSGGMGIVLKAYDPALTRTVAVKVLRRERADARARARFVREARAAAGLDHDHVVPVFAVENPLDGPPYLVMPFVPGPTLRERIRSQRRLDPREAARICAEVADGLAAAHVAGLVHRDIKPANIILDSDHRRARIVDFGLVRVLEGSGETTQEGAIAGTPEYMSPEQVREPDRIDARSDIYSLGVTLYEALAGEAPFRGVPHMVLQQVLHDEPVRPRRISDHVPRDLETICLKAIAKEPVRRYQTAIELRDDLRRWLAGEPILARPVGRLERGWRWCRRKPALAGLTATLVAVVVIGFAGVMSQWLRAETNFQDADRQRTHAEESVRRALQTVDRFCTEVSEDLLLNEPGMQPLRKRLLETAREYYQQFVRERSDSPHLRRELARASLRLAQLAGDLGSAEEAIDLARRAATLSDQLAAERPDAPDAGHDRAVAYTVLGGLYRTAQRLPEAATALDTALAVEENVVHRRPEVAGYEDRLALILDNIGLLNSDRKDVARAEPAYGRALNIWERLASAHPDARDYDDSRARVLDHLADLHRDLGRTKPEETALRDGLTLRARLVAAEPANAKYHADLARSHTLLGRYYHQNKRTSEGEAQFKHSIGILSQLAADNPRVTRYQQDLASNHNLLGHLFWKAGQLDDSVAAFQSALEIRERLARSHPEHASFQSEVAASHNNLGMLYREFRRMSQAEEAHRKAITISERLIRNYPDVPAFQQDLANWYNNIGMVYRVNGRLDPALAEYRRALDLRERLAREHPSVVDYPDLVAKTFYNIALVYKDQDQFEKAEIAFRGALATWERLVREQPTRTDLVTLIARTNTNLAHLLRDTGRLTEALSAYSAAKQMVRRLLRDDGRNREALETLRNVHWGRAQTLERLERWMEAVAEWDRTLEVEAQVQPGLYRVKVGLLRARARAHAGRHADAVREIATLLRDMSVTGDSYYTSATAYAAASAAARRDVDLPTAEREQQAEAHAARAVELLAQARAAGFFKDPAKLPQMKKDADLQALHSRADFRTLLSQTEGP